CPTGVDMAKMKIEFLHHYRRKHGLRLKDRLVAFLPRYAGLASKLAPLMNLRDRIPGLPFLTEKLLGLSAKRSLPQWRSDAFRAPGLSTGPADGTAVVLFVDTFNRYFDVENARAALRVLTSAGYRVHFATPPEDRP